MLRNHASRTGITAMNSAAANQGGRVASAAAASTPSAAAAAAVCHAPTAARRLASLCLPPRLAPSASALARAARCPCCTPNALAAGTPFAMAATAFPSPFHTHAFAQGQSGGNAYSSPAQSPKNAATATSTKSEVPRGEQRTEDDGGEEPATPPAFDDDQPRVHIVKLIARAGVASRRDALKLVQSGRVLVDGRSLDSADANYMIPASARVTIDGKPFLDPVGAAAAAMAANGSATAAALEGEDDDEVLPAGGSALRVPTHMPRPRVWLYYKPVGLLVSHKDDERQRRTVFQQLQEDYFSSGSNSTAVTAPNGDAQPVTVDRLLSVGRLDYLSEGLLVLTNTGAIQRFLEHPSSAFARTYRIKTDLALTPEQEDELRRGANVDGFQFKPLKLVRLTMPNPSKADQQRVWYEITLFEGKNRELRALFNHCGRQVMKLVRVGFHQWKLDVDHMNSIAQAPGLSGQALRDQAVEVSSSGKNGGKTFKLSPGQLVEVEWTHQLESARKSWVLSRASAASSGGLRPSPLQGLDSSRMATSMSMAGGSPGGGFGVSPSSGARNMSTSSPFGTSTAFIQPKSHDEADAAPAKGDSHAASPANLPSHIHSATCGCSDAPADTVEERGSEAFLAGLDRAVSAQQASLAQVDSALTAAGSSTDPASTPKWTLASLMSHNHNFVMNKHYTPYLTDRYPYKKLVVVTCMDTRLTELLPMALDLKNGDAKIIKVAGAMVAHPFGSVMRSILVAVYALGAEHILVVGHHDCGMTGLDPNKILAQAKQRGIPASTFNTLSHAGLNLESWLSGFASVQSGVLHSVETIRNHPLLNFQETVVPVNEVPQVQGQGVPQPAAGAQGQGQSAAGVAAGSVARTRLPKISVTGLVICPTTGRLDLLTETDPQTQALVNSQRAQLLAQQQAELARAGGAPTSEQQAQQQALAAVNCS